MATSGTVSQTTILVSDIIDHALRKCGLPAANVTPDIYNAAKNNLYFYLSGLANIGVNLWTIEKTVFGTIAGQQSYFAPAGTVDVINLLYRTVTLQSGGTPATSAGGTAANAFDQDIDTVCTQISTNGNISYDWGSGVEATVISIGVMSNGANTYKLAYESSEDAVTWTTLNTPTSATYADRTWVYEDIGAPRTARYFRIRETAGGTLSVREIVFGQSPIEIPMARYNLDDYTNLVNKTFQSNQVLQYYFKRDRLQPQIIIWPVSSYNFDQLVMWRHRHIQDVSSLTQEVEIPQRWIDAVIAELAVRMITEIPNADLKRIPILQEMAKQANYLANEEERDKAPISFAPDISCYTGRGY